MGKQELQKIAEIYFNKGAKKMFATQDGNFFYPEHENFAISHANLTKQQLITLVPEKVEEVKVEEVKEKVVKSYNNKK